MYIITENQMNSIKSSLNLKDPANRALMNEINHQQFVIKSLIKEAEILKENHPSKDCRSFAASVLREFSHN